MSLGDFRSVFMPFCLRKQKDGKYVVLNREYKPLGFFTNEYVQYEEYPVAINLVGVGATTAKKLSWCGDSNADEIFLYNDGCVPTDGTENMKKYLAKIQILAKLKIKAE